MSLKPLCIKITKRHNDLKSFSLSKFSLGILFNIYLEEKREKMLFTYEPWLTEREKLLNR